MFAIDDVVEFPGKEYVLLLRTRGLELEKHGRLAVLEVVSTA